jgi:hypothetical protein
MDEKWKFRREARRCAYEAMRSESSQRRRMFGGLAKFYEVLGAENIPEPFARTSTGNEQTQTDVPVGFANVVISLETRKAGHRRT